MPLTCLKCLYTLIDHQQLATGYGKVPNCSADADARPYSRAGCARSQAVHRSPPNARPRNQPSPIAKSPDQGPGSLLKYKLQKQGTSPDILSHLLRQLETRATSQRSRTKRKLAGKRTKGRNWALGHRLTLGVLDNQIQQAKDVFIQNAQFGVSKQ